MSDTEGNFKLFAHTLWLAKKNILAYNDTVIITTVKSFVGKLVKIFLSLLKKVFYYRLGNY